MALVFNCPTCEAQIFVKQLQIGDVAKCINCGSTAEVPSSASVIDYSEAVKQERLKASSTLTQPSTNDSSSDGVATDVSKPARFSLVKRSIAGILLIIVSVMLLGPDITNPSPLGILMGLLVIVGAVPAFCGTRWKLVGISRISAVVMPIIFIALKAGHSPFAFVLLPIGIIAAILLNKNQFTTCPVKSVEREIRGLAWLVISFSIVGILVSALMIYDSEGLTAPWKSTAISLASQLFNIFFAIGLLRHHNWARIGIIAISAISLIIGANRVLGYGGSIIELIPAFIFFLVFAFVLLRSSASSYFHRN